MTVNGVDVIVNVNFSRRNGKRRILKSLNLLKEQNFNSAENCKNLIEAFANAIEVNYTIKEVKE